MSEKKRSKKDGADPSTANRRARKRPGSNDRMQNAVPRQSARDTSNFTDTEAGASDRVRLRRAPRPAATRTKGAGLSRSWRLRRRQEWRQTGTASASLSNRSFHADFSYVRVAGGHG